MSIKCLLVKGDVLMKKRRNEHGIYANGIDGEKDVLLCYVRDIDGRKYVTYEKGNKVVAMKSADELIKDIFLVNPVS